MTFLQLVLAAFIFCFVIIPIVVTVIQILIADPPVDYVTGTRDTRFQSAVSDISPGDVYVESTLPPSFIIRAQEQFPEAGIEDNDDAQIATYRVVEWRLCQLEDRYRVVEWRLCQLEDRLEHLEATRKPIKKRREKKGGKR